MGAWIFGALAALAAVQAALQAAAYRHDRRKGHLAGATLFSAVVLLFLWGAYWMHTSGP